MNQANLNTLSNFVIQTYEENLGIKKGKGMTVNPIISEIATWYEKFRNAMNYGEEEVVLRNSIERILKRRLILGGDGEKIATPLVRELIWARYLPENVIDEEIIKNVSKTIDIYLNFKRLISVQGFKEKDINQWILDLTSSQIENTLHPNTKADTMCNFIFHVLQKNIEIKDDTEETRDIQTFIAVRKAYAKDDLAFLRFHLFSQYFGELNENTIGKVAKNFGKGKKEIEYQLNYPLKNNIFFYIKKNTPSFFILNDFLKIEKGNVINVINKEEEFKKTIFAICQQKYNSIMSKVHSAILRSVIFILLTKTFLAFGIEGTYEKIFYGKVVWGSIALNIIIPPILMVSTTLFIKTPNFKNSTHIFDQIKTLLFESNPQIGNPVSFYKTPKKKKPINILFSFLWFAAFALSFGSIIYVLTKLHFNMVSQGVFVFFMAVVSFLSYRINQTAHMYTIDKKQNIITPIVDFFFMPVVQVGRYFTEGVSQINILLFILDFIFETPFKGLFAFFEQWFLFLHSKREYLD